MKIYFKFKKKPENLNGIYELIKNGYSKKSNGAQFKETYKDPECTIPECHSARRSFGDLLSICRTYFPETTEKELAKTLFALHKEIGLSTSFCSTINKLVFLNRGIAYSKRPIDAFVGDKNRKGVGHYSFNMIKELTN